MHLLYYAMLCYAILYYTILYYAMLYYTNTILLSFTHSLFRISVLGTLTTIVVIVGVVGVIVFLRKREGQRRQQMAVTPLSAATVCSSYKSSLIDFIISLAKQLFL